ncbi:hypothetical protein NDU88_002739 [Pleurodeles waltl]|uniref:Uncharacterized protein n=1 Tax=Pleurodeles waltl TaxID=8319 RepID=A0AAV7UAR4_PLEWA|nr:hypothetical protein NDU88_002739 [Pleurodeles waltl]
MGGLRPGDRAATERSIASPPPEVELSPWRWTWGGARRRMLLWTEAACSPSGLRRFITGWAPAPLLRAGRLPRSVWRPPWRWNTILEQGVAQGRCGPKN